MRNLKAWFDYLDFGVSCEIESFTLVRYGGWAAPTSLDNVGARYTAAVKDLVSKARLRDIYAFTSVKAKCPGDKAERQINDLVFGIR